MNPELLDPDFLRRLRTGSTGDDEADDGDEDAGYLRISRDEYEAGDENEALARQKAAIVRAAAASGRRIGRWYVDRGISAWDPKKVRKDYRRWLADAVAGDPIARHLWVLHIDRLYRQPKELEEFLDAAREYGIKGRTVEGSSFDPNNTDVVLQARILVAFAAKESDDKSRRIRRRNAQLRAQGAPHWSTRPFGYKREGMGDDDDVEPGRYALARWVPNEKERAVFLDGVDRFLRGESIYSIALAWQAAGSVQPSGRPWIQERVGYVLAHPRYAGMLTAAARDEVGRTKARDHVVLGRGNWEPLIDEVTHRRIMQIINANRHRFRQRRVAYPYLLTGLMFCGLCRSKLYGSQRRVALYACMNAPGNNLNGCGRISINAGRTERTLIAGMLRVFGSPTNRSRIKDWRQTNSDAPEIEARIAELEARRANLLDVLEVTGFDDDMRRRLLTIESGLQTQRALLRATDGVEVLTEFLDAEDVEAAWEPLTVDRKRTLLGEVFRRVAVHPSPGSGPVFRPERLEVVEWQPWIELVHPGSQLPAGTPRH